MRRFIPYLITAIVFSTLAFGAGQVLGMKQKSVDSAAFIMSGRLAVNEKDLRNMVAAKNLTVYWLGPEAGAKYLLDTSLADGISLRVIYASASTGSTAASETYYEVGTFASPDAFALTQKAGLQPNGVGLINTDGNAIYYDSRDPKNVYVGLKGTDMQVEIFDPRPERALAVAMVQGGIQKIS
ncbi:MAG: hypothetical protein AABY37_06265 [Actinomycetota bacterium]